MRFAELVDTSNSVAKVSGRLEKTRRLADLLERLLSEEIAIAVAYLSGSLLQGRVGLGWSAIARARLAEVPAGPSLEIRQVDGCFERIRHTTGAGSSKQRAHLLADLFGNASSDERDFLVRLISGDLRQGALEGVLSEAIAHASGARPEVVRHAAMMCGDLSEVARVALTEGPAALSRYAIQLFRPVEPMLASPAADVTEALQLFGQAAFELKVDGARIQVHKQGDAVRVFSRALRDVTDAVPEVVEAVRPLAARELIVDGEVIALRADGAHKTQRAAGQGETARLGKSGTSPSHSNGLRR